jgi:hypothetical protein
MKKIFILFIFLTIAATKSHAQKGIQFSRFYMAGGKMLMNLDSNAKNVFYAQVFPNQPHTSFNFLPEINHVNIQIYFRKKDSVQNYRYTILENNKPIVVNRLIDISKLKNVDRDEGEILRSISFGTFAVKNKVITILTYDIEKPQDVYTTVFYGKPIPKAKIEFIARRFKVEGGVQYKNIIDPKDRTDLILSEEEDELTIIKAKTDIDYVYKISIVDKQTGDVVFDSNIWKYGGYSNEARQMSPYVNIDRSVFKKSGDYEIIIEPSIRWTNCRDCDFAAKEIERYVKRYTLSITLNRESYTKKELLLYTLLVAGTLGFAFLIILYFIKKRNNKRLADNEQQKNITKLQLNSIRSQLNPHFLFNALSGIQNLMNKNETDNANKYLSKFARLTRNVLDDKELISLSQEKTLLDDYLQMEQLRFGFSYEINYSNNLDLDNIEIPSMLLQPFVENAVKHGISEKDSDGKIVVNLYKKDSDLILSVIDNGSGFNTQQKHNGLGLSLSNTRISLLNSIYKKNHFTLDVQSNLNGTKVSLTLTDWL